jgi:hypothetical protein
MHPLSCAERMDIEAALRRGSEANDELDLRARNRDARTVAVALEYEQRRHGGRGRHARRNAVVVGGARAHDTILSARAKGRKLLGTRVRFFQAATSAGG